MFAAHPQKQNRVACPNFEKPLYQTPLHPIEGKTYSNYDGLSLNFRSIVQGVRASHKSMPT